MSVETPTLFDDDSASASAVSATSVSEAVEPVVDPSPEVVQQHTEEQTAVTPDAPRDEADRLEPVPTGPVTLVSGIQADVVPLRLREMMKLLKIVTHGAGGVLEQLMGELDMEDPAAFAQTLGALIIMSIPEAENEAVQFFQAMVRPADYDSLTAPERVEQNERLQQELYNPELDDVVTIIERVIRRESEDIRNLGKRIGQAFKLASKTGQLSRPAAN